jgi:sister-chromatid-cohesion protein PDS5
MMDKHDKKYTSTLKLYDLIYEINVINPDLLLSVLPQLECKLKSVHEHERLKAVSLLARMFSEKDSKLARQHTILWNNFLGRFLDIAVAIRIKCVQSTMHFLLNHPKLRPDIISVLQSRQHDADETVRFEVVTAIVETTKRDFKIAAESIELMEVLKERALDKKFKIRRAAMNGLANVYQKYVLALKVNEPIAETAKISVSWIQNKILNGYYKTLDDQLLVERLLITHLVPYQVSLFSLTLSVKC